VPRGRERVRAWARGGGVGEGGTGEGGKGILEEQRQRGGKEERQKERKT